MTIQYSGYTNNLCPNGSFETDPTGPLLPAGWTTVTGQESVYVQAYGDALPQYGNQCLQVTTPGLVAGEGVYGPESVVFTTDYTGSMTIGLLGQTGRLIITAAYNPDGVALASQTVQLDDEFNYVTVQLNGLTFNSSEQVYIIVQTLGPEALTFYIDGVMYEPESPAHPYIDGSFPGCAWGTLPSPGPAVSGTAFTSPSYQQYQFPLNGKTEFIFGGSVQFIDVGEAFPMTLDVTEFIFGDDSSDPTWTLTEPVAAMTDFAFFNPGLTTNDVDPAMTYALWNNTGIDSGAGSYNRPYAMVVPPIDYPTSGGNFAWMRAAYMGLGFQFGSQHIGSANAQVLTDVQLEYASIKGGGTTSAVAVTPVGWQRPRQLQVIIKPDRLNYVPNPSFETNVTGSWTAGTDTTATQVGGLPWSATTTYSSGQYATYNGYTYVSNINSNKGNAPTGLVTNNTSWNYYAPGPPQNVATYANLDYSSGNFICKASFSASAATGMSCAITNLIPGETYISSTYVYCANQMSDVTIECGGAAGDIIGNTTEGPDFIPPGATPYGGVSTGFLTATPFGSGPYGGLSNPNVALPQQWFRISCVFTAGTDSETLTIAPTFLSSASFPTVMYLDAVLLELGDVLLPYFDGNSGPDAMWETGGTTNLARSYYYDQFEYGQHVVTDALTANTPMGISWATPLYATIPTQ